MKNVRVYTPNDIREISDNILHCVFDSVLSEKQAREEVHKLLMKRFDGTYKYPSCDLQCSTCGGAYNYCGC